ncbi:MAG: hypothetical protein L3K09_02575 [Thermoplasmata archaeon]|nr:hypothetical protein [Thermoplasmata archaeon]
MAANAPRPWYAPMLAQRGPEEDEVPATSSRIPTGVPDFDYLTGGLPAGSVVLLVGEAGSGHQEFALTSAVHLMLRYDDPRMHRFYLGSARGPFRYPKQVVYVSASRSKPQLLREIASTFDANYAKTLERHLTFHDLSPSYFRDSVVPSSWASLGGSVLSGISAERPAEGGPLAGIAEAVEQDGRSNLVIVDSLTDLLVRRGVEASDLLTLVKGLRRRAKELDGLVYLLLSRGVNPPATEQALYDSVDGVLSFSWTTNPLHSHRQRTMLIEKFMPVLSRMSREHQGRFVIQVSAVGGLVTTQYERI